MFVVSKCTPLLKYDSSSVGKSFASMTVSFLSELAALGHEARHTHTHKPVSEPLDWTSDARVAVFKNRNGKPTSKRRERARD